MTQTKCKNCGCEVEQNQDKELPYFHKYLDNVEGKSIAECNCGCTNPEVN